MDSQDESADDVLVMCSEAEDPHNENRIVWAT
jgi:hypothetical protein